MLRVPENIKSFAESVAGCEEVLHELVILIFDSLSDFVLLRQTHLPHLGNLRSQR